MSDGMTDVMTVILIVEILPRRIAMTCQTSDEAIRAKRAAMLASFGGQRCISAASSAYLALCNCNTSTLRRATS